MANTIVSDFAKRPAREKLAIFGVIALVLGFLYWQFFYKSAVSGRDEAKAALSSQQARKAKLAKDLVARDDLLKESDELKRRASRGAQALPSSAELPAFFEMFNRKVGEAGVEVRKLAFKKEEVLTNFVKVPLEVEVSGTFIQLKRFFASIDSGPGTGAKTDGEAQDRIITIEGLRIGQGTVKNGEIALTASFTASTFRQESTTDPSTPPGLPGAKPPAATPAATPAASSAAKPAPVVTNPVTGAKIDTDAAMKADKNRIDNAVGDDSKVGGDL